jgi:hypothetical protein
VAARVGEEEPEVRHRGCGGRRREACGAFSRGDGNGGDEGSSDALWAAAGVAHCADGPPFIVTMIKMAHFQMILHLHHSTNRAAASKES